MNQVMKSGNIGTGGGKIEIRGTNTNLENKK